jgi:flagellin-specific chaperone FliS
MYSKLGQQQPSQPTLPRIDLILEIFERFLERLHKAQQLLVDRPQEARGILNQCQLAVQGMAVGLDTSRGELSVQFLRLYEYVGHCLGEGTAASVQNAIDVLKILQESFQQVRPQALDLERQGEIPTLDQARVTATA